MNSSELLEHFAKNYKDWLKLSTRDGIQYQRKLTAKQTKYFMDLYRREHRLPEDTQINGELTLCSGIRINYNIIRIRDGAGLITIEEKPYSH